MFLPDLHLYVIFETQDLVLSFLNYLKASKAKMLSGQSKKAQRCPTDASFGKANKQRLSLPATLLYATLDYALSPLKLVRTTAAKIHTKGMPSSTIDFGDVSAFGFVQYSTLDDVSATDFREFV